MIYNAHHKDTHLKCKFFSCAAFLRPATPMYTCTLNMIIDTQHLSKLAA